MIAIMRENGGKIIYEVDHIDNFKDFLSWLQKLEIEDFSLSAFGYMVHFKTYEERIHYMFGFQTAWDLAWDGILPVSQKETN